MRYRRFGNSELVVSEVGFGAWTIATDWWGKVDDKAGLVHAALDAGVTFFDTAPVYGDDGFGETILAEILGRRDDVIVTTKVGYDIDAPRIAPGHSERPQDWRPESVRAQVEASLRRLGRDHIDLLQLHNVRIEPVRDDHRAHRKRENLLDLFDKADALGFLHGAETGRTIGQAAVAGILAIDGFTTVLPTCVTADEVREYATASDLPLSSDERVAVDAQ